MAFDEKAGLSVEVKYILESNPILLSPNRKALNFSDFIDSVLCYCEVYNSHPKNYKQEYKINETEYRNSIQ